MWNTVFVHIFQKSLNSLLLEVIIFINRNLGIKVVNFF